MKTRKYTWIKEGGIVLGRGDKKIKVYDNNKKKHQNERKIMKGNRKNKNQCCL